MSVHDQCRDLAIKISALETSGTDHLKLKAADDLLFAANAALCKLPLQDRIDPAAKLRALSARLDKVRKNIVYGSASTSSAVPASNSRSLDLLKRARHDLYQCEQVGEQTVATLAAQGQQIKSMRGGLEEINDSLNFSNKLLNKMSNFWRG